LCHSVNIGDFNIWYSKRRSGNDFRFWCWKKLSVPATAT